MGIPISAAFGTFPNAPALRVLKRWFTALLRLPLVAAGPAAVPGAPEADPVEALLEAALLAVRAVPAAQGRAVELRAAEAAAAIRLSTRPTA